MTSVYISVDLEGVAGVATREQVIPGRRLYEQACRLMTAEVNAAVEGAFQAGATMVMVNDSHGPMDNLVADELDERIEYVIGADKRMAMVEQVDEGFDAAIFLGYHAGPDSAAGVLAHTYSGAAFVDVRLDGRSVSELELNALVAGSFGVPVVLVTGDRQTCVLAEATLPGVRTVAVKTGLGLQAARSITPAAARRRITASAAVAVAERGSVTPLAVPDRLVLEADLRVAGAARYAAQVPGTVRTAAGTVRYVAADPVVLLDVLQGWSRLSAAYAAS